MLSKFRAYQASVHFYHLAIKLKLSRHLKDQMDRAAASVSLNLGEGYGRRSWPDKRRHYQTALASLRECQAVLDLAQVRNQEIVALADQLGAMLYRLCTFTP